MITVINKQRKIRVDTKQLLKDAQIVCADLGYSDFSLSIVLVNNVAMHAYNKQYRGIDKPTDVLSFPFYPHLKAGEKINARSDAEKNLGDIIIAPEYVKSDLARWEKTFEERIRILLIHGICHLLGYDHIKDSDYAIMRKEEKKLLRLLTQ